MAMNYNREFYGQEKLPSPHPMVENGKLLNIHTKQPFCDNWVKSYNQYTLDFNKASDRAGQEFMLNQRHSFYMQCCLIMAEIAEETAKSIH